MIAILGAFASGLFLGFIGALLWLGLTKGADDPEPHRCPFCGEEAEAVCSGCMERLRKEAGR